MLPRRHFMILATTSTAAVACLLWAKKTPAPSPTPSPETRHRLYDKAWQWGRRDRLLGATADSTRYHERLALHQPAFAAAEMQRVLAEGYAAGFNHHPEEEVPLGEKNYDQGYRQGQTDAWAGHASASTAPGYQDGCHQRPHAFQRPY